MRTRNLHSKNVHLTDLNIQLTVSLVLRQFVCLKITVVEILRIKVSAYKKVVSLSYSNVFHRVYVSDSYKVLTVSVDILSQCDCYYFTRLFSRFRPFDFFVFPSGG